MEVFKRKISSLSSSIRLSSAFIFGRYINFVPESAQEKLRPVSNEVSEGMSSVVWLVSTSIVGKKSIFVNISHFSASVMDVRKTAPEFFSYCSLFLIVSDLLSLDNLALFCLDSLNNISLFKNTSSQIFPINSLISILPRIDLRALCGSHGLL